MTATWPDRFLGLATLPLQDTDLALAELERATEIGLLGVSIGSHVNGIDLDHERFRPVFRRAAELGCFVLCHPINPRLATALGRFYQSNVIGNPLETTLAFAALSQGGVFDDVPGLRICFVHGGGYIAAAVGRMSHAYDVRPELDRWCSRPDVHLHQVYVDSLTHDPLALRALAASVGVHRVLLGSDYPADMGVLDPLGAVRAAGLPAQDKHAILRLNALEALRIDDVTSNTEEVTTGERDSRLP
jgi:aminocarboxymuconate-semialdehyde decarboxylase